MHTDVGVVEDIPKSVPPSSRLFQSLYLILGENKCPLFPIEYSSDTFPMDFRRL